MEVKSTDRRVVRTRRRLHEALISLILEKGYDQVTVQDILDRADVGRSTFYAHFLNKVDLLMGNLRADVFRIAPEDAPAEIPSVAWMFEHAGENIPLYRALSGTEAMTHIYRNLIDGLQRNWQELLEKIQAEHSGLSFPIDATASYLSHALLGLLVWWLENGRPHSPEEMDRVFRGMARKGLDLN